jgi:hypothetical protein
VLNIAHLASTFICVTNNMSPQISFSGRNSGFLVFSKNKSYFRWQYILRFFLYSNIAYVYLLSYRIDLSICIDMCRNYIYPARLQGVLHGEKGILQLGTDCMKSYWHTLQNCVYLSLLFLLQRFIVAKPFSASCGTQRFINVFTEARHFMLYWARLIQSTS